MQILDCLCKLFAERFARRGLTGNVLPVLGCGLHKLSQYHIGMFDKVGVDGQAVRGCVQMHPVRVGDDGPLPLLQKEDVARDVGARFRAEGIVGQADRPDELGALREVAPHGGAFLVQRTLGGNERHDAARPDLVQRFGEEVVVDQEVLRVVARVRDREGAEGNVAHGGVEELVGQVGLLVALDLDVRLRVEQLRDAPADGIQLYAVEMGGLHAFG